MIYEYPVEQITDLVTRPGSTPETRVVSEPWSVKVHRLQMVFTVPTGFEFDLDSVPRLPLVYLLFKGRSGLRAPCLHDFMYREAFPTTTRLEADLAYWDAMRSFGVPLLWAAFHFLGVRLGGWRGWRKYRRGES